MTYAELGDVRLFFTDEGTGRDPMLFVHGFTGDSNDWIWQLPHFASTCRVIAADLRGHGRSSEPSQGYDAATFADDLARLLARLGCGPVVAVGHSLGGLVVSALAVHHPACVRAVVAIDPAYLVTATTLERVAPLLEALDDDDPVSVVQAMLAGADAASTPAFLRCWHVRRVAGLAPHVLRETLAGMAGGAGSLTSGAAGQDLLGRRRCPVLSVFTDPGRSAADQALFTDPRSRSVVWEGVGHSLHQERPDDLNRLVDAWLASL
jgi:pimeloyl-ACP methyl ester carboxylesterase